MSEATRRQFVNSCLAAAGAAMFGRSAIGAGSERGRLPTVAWGKHRISRLLVGHNPLKGQSYTSAALDKQMKDWFRPEAGHDVELLQRCQQVGINTCQLGAPVMEDVLRRFYATGGKMQWISTFYSKPGKGKEEMQRILSMVPRPIGVQQWGQVGDDLLAAGQIDSLPENLKMMRDTGLLVGLGAHNPQVIEYAEDKSWDVDFYQCCFYHHRHGEVWSDAERQRMVKVIQQVSKPCIGFKVLAGNRHTKTPSDVERAIRFAFDNMKPTDLVLLGMWRKYKDQPTENAGIAHKILG